jgi:endonuclease-3
MRNDKLVLRKAIAKLATAYGQAEPVLADPFQLIIWENIAYLVDDNRREQAFKTLKKEIGLKPTDILAAPMEQLIEILKLGGVHPELRAQRLKESAQIVLTDFEGDLDTTLKLPLQKAIKALQKFPAIGEPGAEKILLFTKTYPVLALESNGLRVCLRLGFGEEKKNYSASYKSVHEALASEGGDCEFLISAHQLLRHHGKKICKRSNPKCDECPLTKTCLYFAQLGRVNRS